MAARIAKDTSGEPVEKRQVKRTPPTVAVTFDLVDNRLVVKAVTRDLLDFAKRVLANPAEVGLYALIEVPFADS
jgi:hypothetical protein